MTGTPPSSHTLVCKKIYLCIFIFIFILSGKFPLRFRISFTKEYNSKVVNLLLYVIFIVIHFSQLWSCVRFFLVISQESLVGIWKILISDQGHCELIKHIFCHETLLLPLTLFPYSFSSRPVPPGFKLLCEVFSVIHGPQEECVRALKNGHLLGISPGGVREALFSDETYPLLWGKRRGFAQVAIDSQVVCFVFRNLLKLLSFTA